MNKVLVTNYMLRGFTGSELAAVDLAAEFASRGWDAALACFDLGGALAARIKELGIRTLDLRACRPENFDLLWLQHFETADACLLDRGLNAERAVFSCLSPYDLRETPPAWADSLSLVLANSPETADMLTGLGLERGSIDVFPNPAPAAFFSCAPRPAAAGQPRFAAVSNHLPEELRLAGEALRASGAVFDHIGEGGGAALVTPELLGRYDAVVTIGRTVQAALAMGLPVYCYDRFGGPGYIDPANLAAAADFNFSGRDLRRKLAPGDLAAELVSGYRAAAAAAPALKAFAAQKYSLPSRLDAVLARLGCGGKVRCRPGYAASALKRQRDFTAATGRAEIQLFVDRGAGFSEEDSQKLPVRPGGGEQDFIFSIPGEGVRALRLDPLNDSVALRLGALSLGGYRGQLRVSPGSGAMAEGRELFFETSDPQLMLSAPGGFGPGPLGELRLKIDYIATGAGAREAYLRRRLAAAEEAEYERGR